MKFTLPFFIITLMLPMLQAQTAYSETPSVEWLTNYDEAVAKSRASSLPILMLFTGSDWCAWCKVLDKEILKQPEFINLTKGKFIFLLLDFPSDPSRNPELHNQNKSLQKKYDITGYPTIILVDALKSQVIGKLQYQKVSPQAYVKLLNDLLEKYNSYKQKTEKIGQEKYSGLELKQLYEQAREFDVYDDVNRIIKAGLASEEKIFFQLESYRFLVQEGSPRDLKALSLRQELLATDPKNEHRLPYQLAVIDFESFLAETEKDGYSPDVAVGPLVSYIEQYGASDEENLWRLEMIISQVYLEHDKITQALKYAKCSHDAAPATVQPEIAKAIHNIQVFAQIH